MLVLLPLMVVLIFSEPVFEWWYVRYAERPADDRQQLDSLTALLKWSASVDSVVMKNDERNNEPFVFNPNNATAAEFIRLGLSDHLAQRIIRFRMKGGKFRIRNDFEKIYGIEASLVSRLYPFIDLPEKSAKTIALETKETVFAKTNAVIKHHPFDLNEADTTVLKTINGIGSKLSSRIVAYRTRLGGFVSLDQLQEIYGLDTVVIGRLKKKAFISEEYHPKTIDINTADQKELATLPYIRFHLARAITSYRLLHGNFKSVEDLKKIVLLDEITFQKIKSYLTVKD